MGQKADDVAGFFGCLICHNDYDRTGDPYPQALIFRAMYRTIRRLWELGIIEIKP